MITVSAPGKLLLFGEHAAVYGHPCIVTAVGQRMNATVTLLDTPEFLLDAEDVDVKGYVKKIADVGVGVIPKGAQFVEIALKNFSQIYPLSGGVQIVMQSAFSHQFGFGSSSASTVCVIKALSELMHVSLSDKALFDLSYKTVLDIQKTGSGFDVAVAIYGGTIGYVKGGEDIERLDASELPFIIGYSGTKADTTSLILDVKKKYDNEPEKVGRIFTAISDIVRDAKKELLEKDWERLGTLMNFNQEYLRDLGVSTEKLEAMIYTAKKAGAYGAKLSGAGGGDCMIVIAPPDKREAVCDAITNAGGQVINIPIHEEGVRTEI